MRYQDATERFDDAAAAALVLDRADLSLLTVLLFEGAQSTGALETRLARTRAALRTKVARLEHAGYVGRVPGATGHIELTALARTWIETIWGPLERAGQHLLEALPNDQLAFVARFLASARDVQEQQLARVRALV